MPAPRTRALLMRAMTSPRGITPEKLRERTGLTPWQANAALRKALLIGWVRSEGTHPQRRWFLTPAGRLALKTGAVNWAYGRQG